MNKTKLIAQFLIFLMIMLPVSFAAEDFEEEGETLIIEAKKYEPQVLRSDSMEQLNIPVLVTLGAIRGTPISVPEINSVKIQLLKTQEAQKENASIKGTSQQVIKDYIKGTPKFYKANPPTLDNLGYVKITLNQIPQEHKVPAQIDMDFKATITYEAQQTAFTIGGENSKFLQQRSVEYVKDYKEKHSILSGRAYLRLASITGKTARIEVLDQNFEKITTVTLDEGEISKNVRIDKDTETEPSVVRLKLEEIKGAGVVTLEFEDGERSFEEREKISGDWMLSYYTIRDREPDKSYIRLTHPDFKARIALIDNDKYDELSELQALVDDCGDPKECKPYKKTGITNIEDYKATKEEFIDAINSLELMGLKKLVSLDVKQTQNFAEFYTNEGLNKYFKESKIGKNDCCEVTRISTDSVSLKGLKTCDTYAISDTITIKLGETEDVCGDSLELRDVTSDKTAVVTSLPGTGKGQTTTYFSIHIPVEERLLQYTPEELQEKINRTQKTIEELDETIADLSTLVEGWTKICLATAAVFTVMSFFQGMGGPKKSTDDGGEPGEDGKTGTTTTKGQKITLTFPQDINELWVPRPIDKDFNQKSRPITKGDGSYIDEDNVINTQGGKPLTLVGYKLEYKPTKGDIVYYTFDEAGQAQKLENSYDGSFRPGDSSTKNYIRVSSDLNNVVVPVKDCNMLPGRSNDDSTARGKCKQVQDNKGTALFAVYDKEANDLVLWYGGSDSKYYKLKDGQKDGDYPIATIDTGTSEGRKLKDDMVEARDAHQRGEKTFRFRGENLNLEQYTGTRKDEIECAEVMSPGQCKILFNACDPVMCPSSRCDFNDRYRVDNVIQSGFVGSLLLCLPNIKDGVIMPICLSGLLASLKNLRSILQGYVSCLQTALHDDESVGICDRIRSIYICQILWREAMTLLGLAKGNLFDATLARGGGEYLTGVKGGVAKAKQTVDYFTSSYAKNVFSAYTGRSSKEIGATICEKAIYGKGPILGDIMEDITKAQNPPQFTAYIEEQPYSEITGESIYKLYYHIYAGSETVNYKVFVRGQGMSDYTCKECSGNLEPEGYVDKSTSFIKKKGFQQICVTINNKLYCDFGKLVSSSFGLNQANQYVLEYELSKKIDSEEECRSDPRGYSPEAQVEKVCDKTNPALGKGSDIEGQWHKVGTCGVNKDKIPLGDCWMRLGDIEQHNPELYRETVSNLCENEGGKVCAIDQKCEGNQDLTTVRSLQNVECCYGSCIEDETYTGTKSSIGEEDFVKSDTIYTAMYEKAIETCSDEKGLTTDPFLSPPIEWGTKKTQMKDAREGEPDYAQYHYFRGMLYLLCNNCGDASAEFNTIKTGPYYEKACKDNSIGNDGPMYAICKETCEGKKAKDEETTEDKTESPIIGPLQLKELTFKLNDKTDVEVTPKETKELEFMTGGNYQLINMEFNRPVSSCQFTFDTLKTVELTTPSTICAFTEEIKFSPTEGSKINILGQDRDYDPIKDDVNTVYSELLTVNLTEAVVQSQGALLCKIHIPSFHFCITNPGEMCSDYYSKGEGINIRAEDSKFEGLNELTCQAKCVEISTGILPGTPCTADNAAYTKG
ncbi:MAG: hypothetical protein KKA79_02555 [Nanoarchaeota archaeon]|nr:hypothetical protein [Nanoarchaeota archaeon]